MVRCPLVVAMLLFLAVTPAWTQNHPVVPTGAMRNTMFKGQLAGLVQLDGLASPGTYGIGPLEYLRGELLLWDGHAYVATAVGDSAMTVEELPESRAPFFVHQHVGRWTEVELPDQVHDHATLDAYLTERFADLDVPFAFKLAGRFDDVATHLVDVPPGTSIAGPEDAHRWNKHFHHEKVGMDMLGFFSTKHQAVFTHHDSHIHVHAISEDRDAMGHVEEMRFRAADVRLFVALPDR